MKKISILLFFACLTVQTTFAQNMALSYGPMVAGAETSRSSDDSIHVVQSGQTLYAIARLYNTTIENLQALNNLTDTNIRIGQKLKVLQTATTETTSPNTREIPKTEETNQTGSSAVVVTRSIYEKVLKGETLKTFAQRVGATVDYIKEKNGVNSVSSGEMMIVREEQVQVMGEPLDNISSKSEVVEATNNKKEEGDVRGDLGSLGTDKSDKTSTEESTEEKVDENQIVEFVNPNAVLGTNIETGSFVVKDTKNQDPYYIYHKSLEKGTKVKIHIPDNAGYIVATVIGKPDAKSTGIFALSPACVRIIGGKEVKKVTISY